MRRATKNAQKRSPKVFLHKTPAANGILPENNSLEDKTDKFEQKLLANPVLIRKTKMRQTERGLIVSLSEAGFFAPGDAVVSKEAEEVINSIAESTQRFKVDNSRRRSYRFDSDLKFPLSVKLGTFHGTRFFGFDSVD